MFKYIDLTICRRFVILGVLVISLFILASNQRVAAIPCCDNCYNLRDSCLAYCNSDQIKDWMVPGCIMLCEQDFNHCSQFCEVEPGIFGCP